MTYHSWVHNLFSGPFKWPEYISYCRLYIKFSKITFLNHNTALISNMLATL